MVALYSGAVASEVLKQPWVAGPLHAGVPTTSLGLLFEKRWEEEVSEMDLTAPMPP